MPLCFSTIIMMRLSTDECLVDDDVVCMFDGNNSIQKNVQASNMRMAIHGAKVKSIHVHV